MSLIITILSGLFALIISVSSVSAAPSAQKLVEAIKKKHGSAAPSEKARCEETFKAEKNLNKSYDSLMDFVTLWPKIKCLTVVDTASWPITPEQFCKVAGNLTPDSRKACEGNG